MRHGNSRFAQGLIGVGVAIALALTATLTTAGPASATGSFAVANDDTGVAGPQTAGTKLRPTTNRS